MKSLQENTPSNLPSMINAIALLNKLSATDAPKNQKIALSVAPFPKTEQAISLEVKEHLDHIFEIFHADIVASRDRLVALNHGRRTLIERRLEVIARKIAHRRGERFQRTIALTEVLKDTFREETKTITQEAWEGFIHEVALYHVLELFFLKSLHVHGRRLFATSDLGRMNFAAHCFLSQHAAHFSHDKYCWNFVRTNLYSWHVLSNASLEKVIQVLEKISPHFTWNDLDLISWINTCCERRLPYLEFSKEKGVTDFLLDFLETKLRIPLVSHFQNLLLYKKVFIPTLESGTLVNSITDKLLTHLDIDETSHKESTSASALQLQHCLWACETENLELFLIEVLTLLKILRHTLKSQSKNGIHSFQTSIDLKLPQAIHAAPILGLELHNLDQLPLAGSDFSKMHQGSAGKIQQQETFDIAFVMDHLDRLKSGRWMSALREGLPYWRNLVSSTTNLNWGELHLALATSKLRETGYCLYLSHRVLPEGGDGDKLRKALLSSCTFEYFLELDDKSLLPYRYLYVFKKNSNKTARDAHKPHFGRVSEEANCTQAEITERGWDHLFVRGASPLIRHLNQKFPKLFQIATIQTWNEKSKTISTQNEMSITSKDTNNPNLNALEISSRQTELLFVPNFQKKDIETPLIFAHNALNLPWIECLLNSPPVQFWIKHQLLENDAKQPIKLQDLKNAPILDLTHACVETVHDALRWINQNQHDLEFLEKWALKPEMSLIERQAKYVALAKRCFSLELLQQRYQPLFRINSNDTLELKPEMIGRFYPEKNLSLLSQAPEIRIQYMGKELSPLLPENWILSEVNSVLHPPQAFIIIKTKQGPSIQLHVPMELHHYIFAQLKTLQDHTWAEVIELLRIPNDIALFTAQSKEITRVFEQTLNQIQNFKKILSQMVLELFEIPQELRSFLS